MSFFSVSDIFKVGNTEMARVLTMVESACPSALSRKVDKKIVVRVGMICRRVAVWHH